MGFTSEVCSHCMQNCSDNYSYPYNYATCHCTPVKYFWKEATDSLPRFLGCHIPLSPSLCLLGDISTFKLPGTNSSFLLMALTIAKKTIFISWNYREHHTFGPMKRLPDRLHLSFKVHLLSIAQKNFSPSGQLS